MTYKTDIEIAQVSKLLPIRQVAEGMGIHFDYLELYGNEKAKIDNRFLADMAEKPDGKLILVTALTPTPPGEGKTTVSIRLGDGLRKLDNCPTGTLPWSCFWHEGRRGRRRLCPGGADGGYQPSFYRRFPCNQRCQ